MEAREIASPIPTNALRVAPPTARDSRERGVTARVVALSLSLAVVFGYALPVIDYKFANTFLGAQHLPPGAIGVLLAMVVVVNPLLRVLGKALSRNEALTIYIACLFSSLVPGHGSENIIIPTLVAPFYYATQENKWLEFLQPYLKPWLTPSINADGTLNAAASSGWYVGSNGDVPWGAWLVPLAFWGSFVLVSYVMLGCLSVMLRAQWGEKEALAFPLLRLPLAMTEDLDHKTDDHARVLASFFRNPTMWCGFGIVAFVQLLRGLHLYFPEAPNFPLEVDSFALFSEAPWNQIGVVPISLYPMVIGVAYLLTSEVSFSLWFFYWFMKFQLIVAYLAGFPPNSLPAAPGLPDKVFTGYQQMGCYLAYVGLVLWTARAHLWHVARRAFGRAASTREEASEALSYPVAFWGFVISFALMVGATCLAGVRIDIALALWISYLVLAIGLTRVAVEGGMLALQHHAVVLEAMARLVNSGQSQWLTLGNGVVPASFFQTGLVNHMRGFVMPSFMHSFKLAHDHKIAARPLTALIAAVILISVSVSWYTCVRLGYDNSGLALGHAWYARLGPLSPPWFTNNMLNSNGNSAPVAWTWLGFGALLTYGMMAARSRFAFFPFHPIGYIMALTYPTQTFWFSIFVAWLAKKLLTRFGGTEVYRKATPFFLGLVLGDVVMIIFWLIIDGWQGRQFHQLLPG